MPVNIARQIDALLTPEALGIFVTTLTIWAGSHFFGVGEIVDVGLLLVGAFFVGWSITDVAENLLIFGDKTINAQRDEDIDIAARAFAAAVVTAGLTAVMALLLRRSATQLQATRGSSMSQVIRPRSPGLAQVGADSQAGRFWRRPSVTGDASLPAGEGATTAFGDVTYSTAGTATEQQLARVHELVHSFLSPRLGVLRTFRARLAMSGYMRSAILQYLEEALAESVAQLAAHGVVGLLRGIRFPIANGYITLQQLVSEGAEIGTILVGTQRFSVQIVVASPPPVCASAE
jgi:hypothetical protein